MTLLPGGIECHVGFNHALVTIRWRVAVRTLLAALLAACVLPVFRQYATAAVAQARVAPVGTCVGINHFQVPSRIRDG